MLRRRIASVGYDVKLSLGQVHEFAIVACKVTPEVRYVLEVLKEVYQQIRHEANCFTATVM
jgi:hypothetical protein